MDKMEADKILSYLQSAYPNADWKDEVKAKEMRAVWHDFLVAFPYLVAQKACKAYISQGGKFFPAIGEFVKICDEIWQKQELQQHQENVQAVKDAAKMLFYEPINRLPYNAMIKQAVKFIRDVTSHVIKYNSPEWHERYAKIFEGVKPKETDCICDNGLVHYTKNGYNFVGACTWCGKGNKGYPAINPETLQRESVRI